MMADDVLLTGHSGFLGSIIYETIRKRYNITTIGRTNSDICFDFMTPFFGPPFPKSYSVVHLAGVAHSLSKSRNIERNIWDINYKGTRRLCQGFEKSGRVPDNFIFISTVAVYGLERGNGISEEEALSGKSPYALSKIEAERWLIKWANRNNVNLLIFRLPLVAGINPPGNLGAMIRGIKTGRYLSIDRGSAKKSIVLAEDVGHIIGQSIGKKGIYNLTDGYHPSLRELEDIIAKQLGKSSPKSIPISLAKVMAKVGDWTFDRFPINTSRLEKILSTLTFNDDKARAELGWNPHRVIDGFKIS